MQSAWDKFSKELSAEISKAYPYAVSIGVGTMSKDVTPPKRFMRKAPERRYVDHVHVLVLDRPVPPSEWVGMTGAAGGDIGVMQQNLQRSRAIQAIGSFCAERRLPFEYHFAPCAFVELGPAVIESIKRTAQQAQTPAVPNVKPNREERRAK